MILASQDVCTGCAACVSICPQKAIAMVPDSEGFSQPWIDSSKCIECGLCRKTCPVLMAPAKNHDSPKCFAFKTKDRELLRSSSSGGAFTELALPVIRTGGVVFGCVMTTPDFVAHHVMAESESALAAMRGSKYVQSDIGDVFIKCKEALLRGRKVLFSGTSCQIAGLKAFLGNEYVNLTTVDFICHGVPSPAVWRKYLDQRKKETKSKIDCISFRNKHYSWKKSSLALFFDNAKLNSINPLGKDLYFKAFIGNYCLRKCCYVCAFKPGMGSISDITIADFWGIEDIHPEFFNELGVSAIVIHTSNGTKAFADVVANAHVLPVNIDDVTLHNPSYCHGVPMPSGRPLFMRYFRHVKSYETLLKLATRYPFGKWFFSMLMRKLRLYREANDK